jgi:hypothetical protein
MSPTTSCNFFFLEEHIMPEKELRLIATSILAGSGLIALAIVSAAGW